MTMPTEPKYTAELKTSFTYTEYCEDTPGCAANVDIKYSNLNYCGVVYLENRVVKMLESLTEAGWAKCAASHPDEAKELRR